MGTPAVSVILPFYNAAETLGPALDSIRGQTFEDWELVAFDDGSTDASREIADAAAKRMGVSGWLGGRAWGLWAHCERRAGWRGRRC